MEPARPGVTRRTVLRTAAWSTPVIAAAVAAPLASASGETALDLGVSMDHIGYPWQKRHYFSLHVFDAASSGQDWAGVFYLDYFVSASEEEAHISAGDSNLGVGASSTPGWSYVGLGPAGTIGPIKATFKFAGVIPAGSAASLYVQAPYHVGIGVPAFGTADDGSVSTMRSARVYDVAGTPNTDTLAYNAETQPITYIVSN